MRKDKAREAETGVKLMSLSEKVTAITGRGRVLVVDDNRDSADSLAMMLALMGHEVQAVYDGQAAVDNATNFHPQVVLLDIGMPRVNGYEAARRIREKFPAPSMVLIAMTGWGQEDASARSREAGFDHHLVKPVDPEALEKLLVQVTKVPRA